MDAALQLDTTSENKSDMKGNIQWWQAIIALLSVIVGCWGMIYMYSKDNIAAAQKVENHEVRISQLEKQTQITDSKLDRLDEKSTQILIILNEKENKK